MMVDQTVQGIFLSVFSRSEWSSTI